MSTQVDWLQGRSIQSVRYGEETEEWIFDFGEHHVLQVAAPWRLLKEGRIELGQCDHNQRFGLPAAVDAPIAVLEAVKAALSLPPRLPTAPLTCRSISVPAFALRCLTTPADTKGGR